MIEYEAFDGRQRVRRDGRIVGYVGRYSGRGRAWYAQDAQQRPLGLADTRREATAMVLAVARAVGRSPAAEQTPDAT